MSKQDKRQLLDDVLLDTNRIESLNNIINEIGDDLAGKDNYLADKIYSLSYCINELLKATNDKITTLYTNVSNDTE